MYSTYFIYTIRVGKYLDKWMLERRKLRWENIKTARREIGFKVVNCFELTEDVVSRLCVINAFEYLGSETKELALFSQWYGIAHVLITRHRNRIKVARFLCLQQGREFMNLYISVPHSRFGPLL